MNLERGLTASQRQAVEAFRKRHRTGVLALLFTDIVGSTEIKQRLGDAAGTQFIKRRHELVRKILSTFSEAEEISTAGDSFFIVFVKPSDSVRFALQLQNALRTPIDDGNTQIQMRVGIHMGEVFIEENGEGVLERDVLGVQVDTAARVVSLAAGEQILLTRSVFDNARTILTGETLSGIGELSWVNHGPYMLKGLHDPQDICEVGERDKAKLRPPIDTDSGKRATVASAEPVLGWRPALEQVVPGTEWEIEHQLGEGGFGEVWLARHRRTKEQRVFKFCFRGDQLRSLKREMTLFRLLKEVLGERPDIARLYNVQFEEAPYYLELEYTPGGDLTDWADSRGGIENVPIEERLEIVAQVATALAAAHSVGVIHEDVKPSNVLVEEKRDGSIQVRLTDFGIGELVDRRELERIGITASGFTEAGLPASTPEGYTGTRLYMAPELIAGRAPSTKSDLYSLGILLYQMIIGDLSLPVATDWERSINDPLLRDDLHGCLAGDPADRFAGAEELAERLRAIDRRRLALAEREAAERTQLRRQRLAMVSAFTAGLLLVVAVALGYGLHRAKVQRAIAIAEKERAQREQYYASIGLAQKSIEDLRFDRAQTLLTTCPVQYRNWEWGRLQYRCNPDLMTFEGHAGKVTWVAFSPDGKRIATASEDRTAKVWDAITGQELLTLAGHERSVSSVAFSPDGKVVATASEDVTARLWNAETGRELRVLKGHTDTVWAVSFSPDGRHIATASEDKTTRLWDVEAGAEFRTLAGHTAGIHSVAFSPHGRRLATASYDRTAKVWDAETGAEVHTLTGHVYQLVSVAFSPDGRGLATVGGRERTVKFWDSETGRETGTLTPHSSFVHGFAFSPEGTRFATAGADHTAKLWDLETRREVMMLAGHGSAVTFVSFSPDGRRLVTASGDNTAKLWDLERTREPFSLRGHLGAIRGLAFSPDGKFLATASFDYTAKLWDPKTGRELRSFTGHAGGLAAVAFSPDGRRLATASVDKTARIWDAETGRELMNFVGHTDDVMSVAFSPDGQHLATGSLDTTARLWNAETQRELRTFKGHTATVAFVVFSPDGRRLATAGYDRTARIWDVESGREIRMLTGHMEDVLAVAFSPDGKSLATASADRTAKIWDAESGRMRSTLKGHGSVVTNVAFSPDGKRLATTDTDRMVMIWDATEGRELLTLRGHEESVRAVAFSPDGRLLASGGLGETVILWPGFPWEDSDYPGDRAMSLNDRIDLYKREYWRNRISEATPPVRRIVDSYTFESATPVRVKLNLSGPEDASVSTVIEHLPAGWTAEDFSHGGKVRANRLVWDLASQTSPPTTLGYTAVPPAGASTREPVAFTGTVQMAHSAYPQPILATPLAPSGVWVFQNGALPDPKSKACRDAHILQWRLDHNTGGCRLHEEGSWSGGAKDFKKILIRFDLSSVPSTFSLQRAELRLFSFAEAKRLRHSHTIYAARLLKPWNAGLETGRNGAPAREGDVTFNSAREGLERWETPGALGVTDVADCESSASVGANWPEWVTLDVTRSVRRFLTNPRENYGWKISQDPDRGIESSNFDYALGGYMYKSSEAPEVHLRPMLILIPSEPTKAIITRGE